MASNAGPPSPDLISFDDEPEILSLSAAVDALSASAASVGAPTEQRDERASSAALPPAAPVEIAPVGGDDADQERSVLHFFVSCMGVDGSLVAAPTRSAQTLVRGALNMFTQTTAAAMNGKPVRVKATDVNVEVRVSRELPLDGSTSGCDAIGSELTAFEASEALGFAEKKALPAAGLLDSESYWSERHKSRNPRFSVGFSVRCRSPAAFDRHVQIMVMVPDENSTSNRNSQVFGYAQTSFQEMFTVATSGGFQQRMTLPVHSSVCDGATVELQFADLQPQQHPLFRTQHNLFRSFLFYPLMRPEHEELQAASATLAVEEAAEVAFSVQLPLQLLRVCQFELLQMYDEWKARYNYARKKNRHFEDDAEALSFGHDVFRVQVVSGRDLRVKSSSSGSIQAEESDVAMRAASKPAGFSMGGPNGLVRRIKSGKWGASGGSGSFSSDGGADSGLDTSSGVHPFVVIKFEDGVSGNHEFTVGRTNTEYDSPNPVWSTNTFASSKCPHAKPSTKFYAATALRSRVVVSPVNGLKQFVFYRHSVTQNGSELTGWLRFQVFNESYSYMNGVENELIGEVMIPLQSVRDAMTVEEKTVFDDADASEDITESATAKPRQIVTSLTLVDWFDVRSPTTDEVLGEIQLRLNILLANPVASSSDELLFVEDDNCSSEPRRYRQAADCSPPPADGPLETEMPLNFLYPHVLNLRKHVAEVTDMIRLCEHLVEEKKTFKSSLHKKRADIQAIPTNLHVAYFRIFRHFRSQSLPPPPMDAQASTEDLLGLEDVETKEPASISQTYLAMHEHLLLPEIHATVTCGAPTAHALGLTDYGLREMELDMHHLQGILEKCTPTLVESSVSAGDALIPEDSTAFVFPLMEDGDQTDGEDDSASTDSGVSSDAAVSVGTGSPPTDSVMTEEKPPLKKKGSKYSMAARAAVGRRAKALSKKRLVRRKSSRQVGQRESDEKTGSNGYAKYPTLRIDPDEGVDPTTSINYAVRVLCRLDMLRADYYLRKSVAVSQSVSSLVTCFVAKLDLCLQEKNEKVLEQLAKIGFLVGWESLISSHGKELHMISDAWVAIKCLETFAFQLVEADDKEVSLEKHDETGYVIKVPVPSTLFTLLPENLQAGDHISVTSALFTQGINEMQSLANMVGHSGVSIQRKINTTSFRSVVGYYNRFTETCGVEMSSASVGSHPDEILRNLRVAVESENSASKNTCILLHAADAVRSLNGGRVTYCKSGKDRTAMSATLEQARLLVQRKRHVLQEIEAGSATEYGPLEEVKAVANTMREFGVRIHIANKNVGRYKYSFNSLQRKLLPEIYRPPMSTIQDMVTSVTARDS